MTSQVKINQEVSELLESIVSGLESEGYFEDGGSPVYREMTGPKGSIKIWVSDYYSGDPYECIKIRFSAPNCPEVRRDYSTRKNRKFWKGVENAAKVVSSWPKWKRGIKLGGVV